MVGGMMFIKTYSKAGLEPQATQKLPHFVVKLREATVRDQL